MAGSSDVKGLEGTRHLLKQFPAQLEEKILKGAMKAAADEMSGRLQAAAPVLTGRLEDSIAARLEPKKQRLRNAGEAVVTAVVWIRGVARKYWHLPEYGTKWAPAHPYVRPTFAAGIDAVTKLVGEYVRKRAAREARRLAKEKGNG